MSDGNPYVGPRPFDVADSDRFFGRNREVNELTSLVFAHRVLILYAQSGAGKTSLLKAGLTPSLEEEGFEVYPVSRVAGLANDDALVADVANVYIFNAVAGLSGREYPDPSQSISGFLGNSPPDVDEYGERRPRLLIVDQLEELFTVYPDRWGERQAFFGDVRDALTTDPQLRLIFSLREDYLAQLDPYLPALSELTTKRFRLDRLRRAGALSALVDPLRATPRSFTPGVAEALVDELMKIRVEVGGVSREVEGEYVEPVQLQVVGETLWNSLPANVDVIDSVHVRAFGDVNQALTDFYERAIEQTTRKGVREGKLRAWFDKALITQAETRGTVYQGPEETGGMPNAAVATLENAHVIRGESQRGSRWFELTHDRFVGPIRASNARFRSARRGRRTKLGIAGGITAMGVFSIAALAAGGSAGVDFKSIDEETPVSATLEGGPDAYRLKAEADEVIKVKVTSELATFRVGLFRISDGQLGAPLREPVSVAADKDAADDGAVRRTVTLEAQVPAPGDYAIEVSSAVRGAYTVQYSVVPGTPRPELRIGVELTDRSLRSSDQVDEYEFQGVAGESIEVALLPSPLDGMLSLISAQGAVIGFVDNSGPGAEETLVRSLPEDGRYIVSVEGYEGSIGDYSIIVRRPVIDEIVFDVPVQGAVPATEGQESTTYYRFDGEKGSTVSFVATAPNAIGYGEVTLTAPSGQSLGAVGVSVGPSSGPSEQASSGTLLRVLPEDGTYLVTVTVLFEEGSSGSYTLSVTNPELLEITENEPVTGDLGGPGQSTTYRFAGTTGETIVIEPSEFSDPFFGVLEIMAPSGSQPALANVGTGLDVPLQVVVSEDGDHLVTISTLEGGGTYSLRLSKPDVESIEIDDELLAEIEAAGDRRVYRFTPTADGFARPLLRTDEGLDASMVINVNGYVYSIGDGVSAEQGTSFRFFDGQEVVISVVGVDGSTGTYTLEMTAAEVIEIGIGDRQSATIDRAGESAFFRFTAVEGETVKAILSDVKVADPLILLAFADDQFYSFESLSGNQPELAVSIPVSGTHVLQVSDLSGGSGSFTLTLDKATVQEIATFDASSYGGAGEFVGSVIDLVVDDGATVEQQGFLELGQTDQYTFCAEDSDIVSVRMDRIDEGSDEGIDPSIDLYFEDGLLLTFDDDSGGGLDSLITYELPFDGCYSVLAYDRLYSGTGGYQLTVTRNA